MDFVRITENFLPLGCYGSGTKYKIMKYKSLKNKKTQMLLNKTDNFLYMAKLHVDKNGIMCHLMIKFCVNFAVDYYLFVYKTLP